MIQNNFGSKKIWGTKVYEKEQKYVGKEKRVGGGTEEEGGGKGEMAEND